MKINFSAFSKITSWVRVITDRDPNAHTPTPHRDWQILLTVFFVTLVASSFAHFFIFRALNEIELGATPASKRTINERELSRVIEVYEAKERVFNELRSSPPVISDPSR